MLSVNTAHERANFSDYTTRTRTRNIAPCVRINLRACQAKCHTLQARARWRVRVTNDKLIRLYAFTYIYVFVHKYIYASKRAHTADTLKTKTSLGVFERRNGGSGRQRYTPTVRAEIRVVVGTLLLLISYDIYPNPLWIYYRVANTHARKTALYRTTWRAPEHRAY